MQAIRFLAYAWTAISLGIATPSQTAAADAEFHLDIEPIFKKHCQGCHGAFVQMNGLRLDSRAAAMAGSHSGPVIKPSDAAGSTLLRLVSGAIEGRIMPPSGARLSDREIATLRAWIDSGAKGPEESAAAAKPKAGHWAFISPRRADQSGVRNSAWVRGPIDSFILARLEKEGVAPSPEAEPAMLIRRVTLDIIGLLPTPKEVADFLEDSSPNAYGRLVDRLLSSPHYGEKWARPWMDLARYADSDGFNQDRVRPYAWRWRDWVIDALNRNMPFDQFTIEQLAGDLLPGATVEQKIATGFHRNTLTMRESGSDSEEYRVEQVIDRTATTSAVWLGLTAGCARCHDYKFDPISQKEFYQLTAFFNTTKEIDMAAPLPGELTTYLKSRKEYDEKRREILAASVQLPAAALIADLKQRGLLDSTLVVWAGEFGRTPLVEKTGVTEGDGRDHHPLAFSVWMAGGGIKGGQVVGKTDDLGLKIVEDKVHIHDLHATMLHCLGMDHERLTYRSQGRDFRLTDVSGTVVRKLLA